MTLTRKTSLLAWIAALLTLVAVFGRARGPAGGELPTLPAIDASSVTRVSLHRGGQVIHIDRVEGAWTLVQPWQASADTASVESLLKTFRQPLGMDLKIDEKSPMDDGKELFESYLVDDQKGVLLEVFTGDDEPALSVIVGKDIAGGASAVRLPRSGAVYRASLGGRSRFDREPDGWRNKSLLSADPDALTSITLHDGKGERSFSRHATGASGEGGGPAWENWYAVDAPAFPLDQRVMTSLARALCVLKAIEVHAEGFGGSWDDPDAIAILSFLDGSSHQLRFRAHEGGRSVLARVDDRPEVFRIAYGLYERILQPLPEYRDRALFDFPISRVASLSIEQGPHRVRIEQDLGSGLWGIVEPIKTDADQRAVQASARAMGSLRATGLALGTDVKTAGLEAPVMRFSATLVDGGRATLEVGTRFKDERGQDLHYVRKAGDSIVYTLGADGVQTLRKAFVRTQAP